MTTPRIALRAQLARPRARRLQLDRSTVVMAASLVWILLLLLGLTLTFH